MTLKQGHPPCGRQRQMQGSPEAGADLVSLWSRGGHLCPDIWPLTKLVQGSCVSLFFPCYFGMRAQSMLGRGEEDEVNMERKRRLVLGTCGVLQICSHPVSPSPASPSLLKPNLFFHSLLWRISNVEIDTIAQQAPLPAPATISPCPNLTW